MGAELVMEASCSLAETAQAVALRAAIAGRMHTLRRIWDTALGAAEWRAGMDVLELARPTPPPGLRTARQAPRATPHRHLHLHLPAVVQRPCLFSPPPAHGPEPAHT